MNTIVYSAIYGDYDKPINQCIKQKPILFSDKRHKCNWSVKVVKKRESSDRMRAKYYKCNPHKELKCDVSIYIDGSGTIKTGKFVERCLELLGDADIAAFVHHERDCIYKEAEFCHMFEKYIGVDIMGQVEQYRKEGWPEDAGLWACGLLIRRHNPRVKKFNELWWRHIRRYTYQDQLSFPVCVKRSGVKLKTINLPLNENNLITFLTPHASNK